MNTYNLYRKTALTQAVEITTENLELLKEMGADVCQYNERSLDAWHEHGRQGEAVIWTFDDYRRNPNTKIQFAQCKTIEGLHTAELPSMLMKGQSGELYFCTKKIFEDTYEPISEVKKEDIPVPDSEIGIWLQEQIKFFTSVEGEIVKVSNYAGGLSIKFKNGNGYTLKLSKQCQVTLD